MIRWAKKVKLPLVYVCVLFFIHSTHTTLCLADSCLSDLFILGGGAYVTQCSQALIECSPLLFRRSSIRPSYPISYNHLVTMMMSNYHYHINKINLPSGIIKTIYKYEIHMTIPNYFNLMTNAPFCLYLSLMLFIDPADGPLKVATYQ